MKNNQIVVIWGSPFSGKTTLAIKLAQVLSSKKKNVIVVHTNVFVPSISTLLPLDDMGTKSLGKLLAEPELSQNLILENLVTSNQNAYISFLGYQIGESTYTYAAYTKEKVLDLIILLRHMADYIIFDCSSNITEDPLAANVLEFADRVLRTSSCDLKGVCFMKSQLPLISDNQFNIEKHIKVLCNTNNSLLKSEITESLSGIDLFVPYAEEIIEQGWHCELFSKLNKKASKQFEEAISRIIKGVFNE